MKPNQKYLIVNADDFGLTQSINAGIKRAFCDGIVTSASIMPNGGAFDQAVILAKQNKGLEIGVHLSLTQVNSILSHELVSTITDQSGQLFKNWHLFVLKYISGRVNMIEVEKELDAQLSKVIDTGLQPSYIDSHQHIHLIPSIWKIISRLAKKHKISFIRHPNEMIVFDHKSFRHLTKQVLIKGLNFYISRSYKGGYRYCDHFMGIGSSGVVDVTILKKYLTDLRLGVTELMCHPGISLGSKEYVHWNYRWQQELEALTHPEVRALIKSLNIQLINRRGLNEKYSKSLTRQFANR